MKTVLKLAAAFALVAGSAGGGVAFAEAVKEQKQLTNFYDEFGNVVGQTMVYCDDSISHWGQYSLNMEVFEFPCGD